MTTRTFTVGKNMPPQGVAPAVCLINPKYDRNVSAALRACSCLGAKQLWWTGNRVRLEEGQRLPREERMKGYMDVEMRQYDKPFDHFPKCTPVAIEVRENAIPLSQFEHPENPLYVFGPEDGSIDQKYLRHCHRFVVMETEHCTNLAAAVYLILYHRRLQLIRDGLLDPYDLVPGVHENRGWADYENTEAIG